MKTTNAGIDENVRAIKTYILEAMRKSSLSFIKPQSLKVDIDFKKTRNIASTMLKDCGAENISITRDTSDPTVILVGCALPKAAGDIIVRKDIPK